MDDSNKVAANKSGWLVAAFILTALYIVFVGIFFLAVFSRANIAQMRPNEVADFLAGIFAPLAFLWLVATVGIQSQELRAQREELAENRLVARDQANEAKKQAEFLGIQTDILSRRQADDAMANMRLSLVEFVRKNLDSPILFRSEKLGGSLTKWEGIGENLPTGPTEALIVLCARVIQTAGEARSAQNRVPDLWVGITRETLDGLVARLDALAKIAPQSSTVGLSLLQEIRIEECLAAASFVAKLARH